MAKTPKFTIEEYEKQIMSIMEPQQKAPMKPSELKDKLLRAVRRRPEPVEGLAARGEDLESG